MKNVLQKLHNSETVDAEIRDVLLECARLRRLEEQVTANATRARSSGKRRSLLREGLSIARREARLLRSCAARVQVP